MAATTQVVPSPQARTLFSQLVSQAVPLGEDVNTLHIDVGNVLAVACRRARRGEDAKARDEITELQAEEWITPAPGGGWFLS